MYKNIFIVLFLAFLSFVGVSMASEQPLSSQMVEEIKSYYRAHGAGDVTSIAAKYLRIGGSKDEIIMTMNDWDFELSEVKNKQDFALSGYEKAFVASKYYRVFPSPFRNEIRVNLYFTDNVLKKVHANVFHHGL